MEEGSQVETNREPKENASLKVEVIIPKVVDANSEPRKEVASVDTEETFYGLGDSTQNLVKFFLMK